MSRCLLVGTTLPFFHICLPRCGAVPEQWCGLHRPIYQALALPLPLNISLNVTSAAHQLPQSTRQLNLDVAQTTCNSPESENEVVG